MASRTAIKIGMAKNKIRILPESSTFEAMLLAPASLHISEQNDAT